MTTRTETAPLSPAEAGRRDAAQAPPLTREQAREMARFLHATPVQQDQDSDTAA